MPRPDRIRLALLAGLLSLASALPGCDDGDPARPDDTLDASDTAADTSLDTAPDTAPDAADQAEVGCPAGACCLTEADCEANGQVLDTASCMCVAPEGVCEVQGEACEPALEQPPGFRCVDDGSGQGVCLETCVDGEVCPNGETCVAGECPRPECAGFFENDCAGGDKCVPVGNGASFCFPNGTVPQDGECTAHSDCAADLLCIAGRCTRPDCDPLDGSPGCGAGATCDGYVAGDDALGIGQCIVACEPFTGSDTCAADGEWCFPGERADDGSLGGTCTADPGGTAQKGATCDNMSPATTCGTPDDAFPPLICLGECEQMCDPQDQTTCDQAGGDACFPVNLVDGNGSPIEVEWGLCNTNCTPSFDPADPGVGCATGEFCWPDFNTPGLAQCFASSQGTKTDGEACDPNAMVEECENTTLCLVTNDAGTEGECTFLCDPLAAEGEPGSCGSSASGGPQTCLPLNGADGPLAVGSCYETCRLDDLANFPCGPDADGNPQYCQVGTLFGIEGGVDLCTGIAFDTPLTEGASCGTDPAIEFNFCKENGLCIDLGTGSFECLELCSEERGQLGAAHPDCGGDVCQGAFGNVGFGVCQ